MNKDKENSSNNGQVCENKDVKVDIADEDTFHYKEGGWGWLVVLCCAICFGTNIALVNVYTLIYNKFVEVYNSTENAVTYSAWVGSTSNGIQFVSCIFSSLMVDFFDARKVGIVGGVLSTIGLLTSGFVNNLKIYFVTYSFALGLGQSLLLTSFLSILPHYFERRLGLANGLMNLGGAAITLSLPFAVEESLKKLGLSYTFFILCGLTFVNVICAFTFKPQLKKEDINETYLKRLKNGLGLQIWKKKRFLIWIFCAAIGFFGYLIPIVTISHHSILNFPDMPPSILSALLGAFSGLSSIFFGKLSDVTKFRVIYFHICSFFLGGILQITIPFADKFYELCIIMALYGLVDGLFLSFIVPISCDVAESPKLANQAIGYFFAAIAVPVIVGPTIAGVLYEQYRTYQYAYFIGGGSCVLGSVILLLIYPGSITTRLFELCTHKRKQSLDLASKSSNKTQTSQVELNSFQPTVPTVQLKHIKF